MATRDGSGRVHVVAIGASAGGIEALRNLVGTLPESFPAAVLVVLHLPTHGTSVLPQILARAGALPAVQATDGLVLEGGQIYVGPPDCHLLVDNGTVCLDRGPRINGHRPAVDPLFRSVADSYGPSGAGVVLSGVLDDGTAGLMAIKQAGGTTLAQDPAEALYDTMPRTAIEVVSPDHVGTAAELGRVLGEIATPLPPDRPKAADRGNEGHLVEVDRGSSDSPQPGTVTGLTCPECNGAIWLDESKRVETALWTALRDVAEQVDGAREEGAV